MDRKKKKPLQGADPTLTDIHYLNLQTNYMKSRSIGVLWAVFSIALAIMITIVLIQPQWLGDTEFSRGTGYFGLWQSCRLLQDGQDLICTGKINDLSTIPTTAFKVATVFVAISTLLIYLCTFTMLLFFFAHPCTVFRTCGWLQTLSGLCLLSGVLIFPAGWDSHTVKEVCGNDASSYNTGQCGIRWAYLLAMTGVVNCFALSILAFTLGVRHTKLLPDQYIAAMMTQHPHAMQAQSPILAYPQQMIPNKHNSSLTQMYSSSLSQLGNINKSPSSNPLVYWK